MAHVHEHEFMVLLVGAVIWIFTQSADQKLKDLPNWNVFSAAFDVFLVSMVLTILEDFVWPDVVNVMEHMLYAVSALLLAFWSWRVFWPGAKERMGGDQ